MYTVRQPSVPNVLSVLPPPRCKEVFKVEHVLIHSAWFSFAGTVNRDFVETPRHSRLYCVMVLFWMVSSLSLNLHIPIPLVIRTENVSLVDQAYWVGLCDCVANLIMILTTDSQSCGTTRFQGAVPNWVTLLLSVTWDAYLCRTLRWHNEWATWSSTTIHCTRGKLAISHRTWCAGLLNQTIINYSLTCVAQRG